MEEFTPQEIAKALHLLRHAKGWTLRELQCASGIAAKTICAHKTRRRRPPLAAVERLLIAMGCTWESLDLARALLREVGGLGDERAAARIPPAGPEDAAATVTDLMIKIPTDSGGRQHYRPETGRGRGPAAWPLPGVDGDEACDGDSLPNPGRGRRQFAGNSRLTPGNSR